MGKHKSDIGHIGIFRSLIMAFFISAGVAAIYYRSALGLIPGAFVGIYVYKIDRKRQKDRYISKLSFQFRTLLQSMMGTLEAGYALKNSLIAAGKDCAEIHSKKCELSAAIDRLRFRLELNESFETAIRELSQDFPIEEMKDFSEVVAVTSKTGGNVIRIIRETAEKIISGIELKEELRTIVASRRLEQQIMTYMPAVMIVFLSLTSPGLLDLLFGNPFGVIVMTVMLVLNVTADFMGKRIVGRLRI